MLKNKYIKLIRPKHWIKNLIIALPLILSQNLNLDSLLNFVLGFSSFSLLASGGYVLNDIRDVENDRLHLTKRLRPLASGVIDISVAFYLAVLLIIIAFFISFSINKLALLISFVYFITNYYYSIIGKTLRFIDIILLSSFYIIRIFYGAIICDVKITGWFVATITLAVLSLSVNKRFMECFNSSMKDIPGRAYSVEDAGFLQIVMINFAMSSIVLLNIHAYFVLNITNSIFFLLLNLLAASISLFYFDQTKNKSEDPVERIVKNKNLLISLFFFVCIYVYEMIIKDK
jgi:decaprenyl-phosphate phosphoribosyltransferase